MAEPYAALNEPLAEQEVPSRSGRAGKSLALLALTIGLGCATLWAFGKDKQVADMDDATSMAAIPMMQQRNFMQPLSPATRFENKCYRAVVLNAEVKGKKVGYKMVEGREVPFNLFKPKEPLKAKVIANKVYPHTITENTGDPNWETVHVTFDHGGKYPYLEGMSLGLISPGPDKNGKTPASVRLYSIASSAVGDDETSNTVSLCVKRVVEVDGKYANREVGEDKPDKAGTAFPDKKVYRGVASNYICDLKVGDEVEITGPVGTEMLLPEDPDAVYIMLATGTGIAPMRSYLRYLFNDKAGANPDGSRKFKGLAWLFLGVPYSKSLLYDDENKDYKSRFPDQYRYEYAISREQKNAAGQKMYIQTKLAEYGQEVWDLMMMPKTHLYVCGLKGMEAGLEEVLGPIAASKGLEYKDLVKQWKKEHRWHVEVY
jgi:ferredoxin--NADP+ reductase